jgi:hypothetical protein
MLLTRPLPPQFLLPAWSRSWLAIAIDQQQRAYTSSSEKGRHNGAKNSTNNRTEGRVKRAVRSSRTGGTNSRGVLLTPTTATTPRYPNPKPQSAHWTVIQPQSSQTQPNPTASIPISTLPLRVSRERKETVLHDPRNSKFAKDKHESQRVQAQAPQLERDFVDGSAKYSVAAINSAAEPEVEHAEDRNVGELNQTTLRGSEHLQQPNNIKIPEESFSKSETLVDQSSSWSGLRSTSQTVREQSDVKLGVPLPQLNPQSSSSSAPPKAPKNLGNTNTLFEELFPEETKYVTTSANTKLSDKLPSFAWQMDRQKIRQRQKALRMETSRSVPLYTDDISPSLESSVDVRKQRREASVVVLNCAPGTLAESDFFRLGPKGNHIQGWTKGIIKGKKAICNDTNTTDTN